MAQAFRSKKGATSGEPPDRALRVSGCYNHDHKVVVEWERFLDEDDLLALIGELPTGRLTFEAIRLVASSWCQVHDASLATMRFTHYRINRESAGAIIAWAEDRGILVAEGQADLPGRNAWTRQPVL